MVPVQLPPPKRLPGSMPPRIETAPKEQVESTAKKRSITRTMRMQLIVVAVLVREHEAPDRWAKGQ